MFLELFITHFLKSFNRNFEYCKIITFYSQEHNCFRGGFTAWIISDLILLAIFDQYFKLTFSTYLIC